jgi:BioD-like phosphotransacetylase family protein
VLTENIRKAFASAARDHDLAIIEGTGHAGVGSVFDLSNAQVARMLDARVVIVTVGGIGRPLDEIALNCSLFEQHGVRVIGAIANKVLPKKLAQTRQYLSRALERRGLPLLGVIPYTERLTWPTVQQVMEILHATVVSGEDTLSNVIASVVICAMTPHHAISYMCDKALLVIPGDRDDNVLAALSLQALRKDLDLAGLVLTGGLNLAPETMDLLRRTDIPVLSVEGATYDTVARINEMSAKIRATDPEKIRLATELVAEHVDVGRIWDAL